MDRSCADSTLAQDHGLPASSVVRDECIEARSRAIDLLLSLDSVGNGQVRIRFRSIRKRQPSADRIDMCRFRAGMGRPH
jgi:hypothetical protein